MDEVASHFGDNYFFVGNAFFLIDDAWPACPVAVRFDLPSGWSTLAPWDGGATRFTASSPATLEKNAFVMGKPTVGRMDAGPFALEWVIDDRLASAAPAITATMKPLPGLFADYFGTVPSPRYVVVVLQGPQMDGGAFRQSFALTLGQPTRPTDALVWSHYLAHEMLHLWLGNQIRGTDPERLYWFTEGFTDYLAIKLGYHGGVSDEAMLQQRLANVVRRVRLAAKISPDVGLAEAGAEKNRHWELIYGGGAMVALLIDAEHPDGFRAALRELSARADAPYSEAALLDVLDRHTDGAARRAYDAVSNGLDFGTIIARLGAAGLEVTGFSPDEVYVRFRGNCTAPECVPGFLRRPVRTAP
jgi:predicted metalloprotease with PDZ domain